MNNLSRTLLPAVFATVAFALPSLAQPTTTVTLSAMSCTKGTLATFTAISLSTNVNLNPVLSNGGATPRLNFSDIGITKNIDDCSVLLYNSLFALTRMPSVVISFYNTLNGANREVMRITLSNAFVTSVSHAGMVNSVPTENVTLSFEQIEIVDPTTGARKGYNRLTGMAL